MHQAEESRSNSRRGPHHSIIASDIDSLVGQVVDERAKLVQACFDVIVREVLVE